MNRRSRSTTGLYAVGLVLAIAIALTAGCKTDGPKYISNLADRSGDFHHDAELPEGFFPLVGLDSNDPDNCVNSWPRYIVCNADNAVMVYIPGGRYRMGTGDPKEGPTGEVEVKHFYMDLCEVNNVQFDRFRKAAQESACPVKRSPLKKMRSYQRPWIESNAGHIYPYELYMRHGIKQKMYPETAMNFWFWEGQTPADIDYYLDYWTPGHNNNDPVRNVSWWEAWYYANWSGKFLPTEAQWEAAARGYSDHRLYPWGDDEGDAHLLCNFRNSGATFDGYEHAAPVAAYPGGTSPFGIQNMAGNVWEWCLDWYDPTAGMRRRDYPWRDPNSVRPHRDPGGKLQTAQGAPSGEGSVHVNPVGPLYGDQRAIRGGSYANALAQCRATSRSGAQPDVHQMNIGFRCVLPLP